eukprot:3934920-Rhodomonas_salina.1
MALFAAPLQEQSLLVFATAEECECDITPRSGTGSERSADKVTSDPRKTKKPTTVRCYNDKDVRLREQRRVPGLRAPNTDVDNPQQLGESHWVEGSTPPNRETLSDTEESLCPREENCSLRIAYHFRLLGIPDNR